MQKNIELYIRTPFRTRVRQIASYNTDDQVLTIKDDKDLNGSTVDVALALAIQKDKESISRDIERHKAADSEKYAAYDPSDIVLEYVQLEGDIVTCVYSVNAGDYRRLCIGIPCRVMKQTNTHNYFIYPISYVGEVCW